MFFWGSAGEWMCMYKDMFFYHFLILLSVWVLRCQSQIYICSLDHNINILFYLIWPFLLNCKFQYNAADHAVLYWSAWVHRKLSCCAVCTLRQTAALQCIQLAGQTAVPQCTDDFRYTIYDTPKVFIAASVNCSSIPLWCQWKVGGSLDSCCAWHRCWYYYLLAIQSVPNNWEASPCVYVIDGGRRSTWHWTTRNDVRLRKVWTRSTGHGLSHHPRLAESEDGKE